MSARVRLGLHGALACLTLLVFVPHYARGLMLYDLGELLFYVQAFLDGRTPGADFVVNGYGPGRYVLIAGLSTVFGLAPLPIAYAVFIALRIGISALVLELSRSLLSPGPDSRWTPWMLFAPAVLLLAPGPLHKGFFLFGTLSIALGAVVLQRSPRDRFAVLFGGVIALAACFRVDLGLYGACALLLIAWQQRKARLFLLGSIAPMLGAMLVLGWLLSAGVLGTVAGQVWHDIVANHTISSPIMPNLGELLVHPSLDRALLWLPLPILGALLWLLLRGGERENRGLWLLLLLGLLTSNQVRLKPEFGHLLQAGPLLWVSAAVVAARVPRPSARWAAGLALLIPALLVTNTLRSHYGSVYTGSFTIPMDRGFRMDTAAGVLRVSDYEIEEVGPVLRAIAEAPPGPLWVPTNQPLLHALTGRPDGTGYVGVLYVAGAPARQQDLLDRLERSRPSVAAFLDDSMEGPEVRLKAAAPPVFDYLHERYVEVEVIGEYRIMWRRDLRDP